MSRFSPLRARAFLARLDVDVRSARVCLPCLSLVSFPLDAGDEGLAQSEARKMTPTLWYEGLAEYAVAVVSDARDRGVLDAGAALTDVERNAGRSAVARALVLALADDLARRTRTELWLEAAARDRSTLAPPELN